MSAREARRWDRLARRYDRAVRLFDSRYPEVAARLQHDLAGRERALEIAAGTGQFSHAIAAVVDELLVTDLSPEMVARLRQAFDVRPSPRARVNVAVMAGDALEIADASLDAIVCANALHVMVEPVRALTEFYRVLVPGGVLIVPTFCHGVDLPRRALSRMLSLVSSFVAYRRLTPRELGELVASAGFVVECRDQLPGLFPIAYVRASKPP